MPNAADHAAAATLSLRPADEIATARDTAERWHWRSRTRQLIDGDQPVPPLPEGLTLDGVVRMVARMRWDWAPTDT